MLPKIYQVLNIYTVMMIRHNKIFSKGDYQLITVDQLRLSRVQEHFTVYNEDHSAAVFSRSVCRSWITSRGT